jgi:preprotein translocase subunit SecE
VKRQYINLLIWVVVIGAIFAFAWWKGLLTQLANYIQETRDELKKCTWPTVGELKGSTAVVMVAIVLLGAFTVGVDFVITQLVQLIL